jgi:hypothetical protein
MRASSALSLARLLLSGILSATAAVAAAQQGDDPLFEESTEPAAADRGWLADLLLRAESTRGFSARDDISRLRATALVGGWWQGEQVRLTATARLAQGSDDNRDNLRNNDNLESDDIGLDTAILRWQPADDTIVLLGKMPLPFAATPMVFDADLRPVGAHIEQAWAVGEFDRLLLRGGYFAGDHLYGDRSRIGSAQAVWRIREGAPLSGEVALGLLDFDRLDEIVRSGLARTNRRVAGRLVSDFRLLDLQAAVIRELDGGPLEARIDLVRNLGADDQRDGVRWSVVYGDAAERGGLELGWSYQRIQRDAVMAAFSADEWWFHSFARGGMPWIAWGFDEHWQVQLSGFFERRDDQRERIDRVFLDVRARW